MEALLTALNIALEVVPLGVHLREAAACHVRVLPGRRDGRELDLADHSPELLALLPVARDHLLRVHLLTSKLKLTN